MALSLFASADTLPAKYLKPLKGALVTSITQHDSFSFSPGELSNCTKKIVTEWLTFQCSVAQAFSTINGDRGVESRINFNQVHIFFKPTKTGDISREFIFQGRWNSAVPNIRLSSPATLHVWYFDSIPQSVRGTLSLLDYSVASAIDAVQAD